jgi:hypothetical protein
LGEWIAANVHVMYPCFYTRIQPSSLGYDKIVGLYGGP